MFARKAFPCFDEPKLKAKFGLKITRPKDWISLFNTELKNSKKSAGGKVMTDEFAYVLHASKLTYMYYI